MYGDFNSKIWLSREIITSFECKFGILNSQQDAESQSIVDGTSSFA